MPVPSFGGLPPYPEFKDVVDKVNRLVNELRNLLLNLDTLNVVELDAEVIIANTITADKMNVTELSAITANLGTITAGSITTNAEINVGTDARIGNVLYLNETNSTASKGISFNTTAGSETGINVISGDMEIQSLGGNITLTAAGDVYANGGKVATQGISVSFDVMNGDGVTTRTLTFTNGVLTGA